MNTLVTSLVIQWLRLHTANAGGQGSIPGWGTRSCMLQLRSQHSQKKFFFFKKEYFIY